jgi:alkylation response protein AidB-like acyl-CoA dehydrogenase
MSSDAEQVHPEARSWFEANWDPQRPLGEWWQRLADSGWGFPTWPTEWFGKGLDHAAARAVDRARNEVGAFGPPAGIATMMVGPMLIQLGTREQQQRYLPAIANGSEIWCQLFSEPGAGSDLAGVQTKAVRDGDEWVVNGQKVWTSGGHYAKWAILVARTDPDVPKHRGLTFFLIDMRQPGIEARPLRQMTGDAEFNEVFLTDARVPHVNMVGEEGGGWGVALNILSHERASLDADADTGGGIMGDLDLTEPAGAFVAGGSAAAAGAATGGAGKEDDGTDAIASATGERAQRLLVELMDRCGRRDDPVARQEVASIVELVGIARYAGGSMPPSAGKLAATRLMRQVRDQALALEGPHGTLLGDDAPLGGLVQAMALMVPGMSIAGGTDEIQRNIVGERVLGLPAEPRVDKDVPFRELKQGTVR